MKDQVLIESIKTDREVRPDRVLELGLVDQLTKSGGRLNVPVLLTREMVLVDGLYRINALRSIGFVTVEAIIAETYEEALENLDLAHEEAPVPRRIYEIKTDLDGLMSERASLLRSRRNMGSPSVKGQPRGQAPLARDLIAKALKSGAVNRIVQIYKAAANGDVAAQSAIEGIEAGTLRVHAGWVKMLRVNGRPSGVSDQYEQRTLLAEAARNIASTVRLLSKLEVPLALPDDEREQLVNELIKQRAELYSIIGILKRGRRTVG